MSTKSDNSKSVITIAIGLGIGFFGGYLLAKKLYSNDDELNIIRHKKTKYRRFITGHDDSGIDIGLFS